MAIRKKNLKKIHALYFPHFFFFLYISKAGDKENLFAHQKVPYRTAVFACPFPFIFLLAFVVSVVVFSVAVTM